MQTQVANQLVDFNEEGFLLDSAQWTPEVAEALAKKAGITLTPEHWKVLTFCREEAVKAGQSPGPRRGKLAAQIAGLPKPKSCL
jgi:TusE/DsrC/DsvC family sulfur relay protein